MVEELVGAGSVTSEAAVLVVICPGCSPSRAGEFGRPVGSFTAEVPEAVIRYAFQSCCAGWRRTGITGVHVVVPRLLRR